MVDSYNMKFLFKRQCENHFMHLFALRRGIFYGDDVFERVLPFTIIRLTLFFVISHSLLRILKPFKQTEFVCNLLTGIILGPSGLGRIYKRYKIVTDRPSQVQFINVGAYIGVLYYVFLISVKTNFGVLKGSDKKVWVIGLSSLASSFFITASLNDFFHPVTYKYPFLVYVFCLQHSSTLFTNLAPMLEELNLLTTELGQLALASSMTNEVVTWCFWMYLMVTYLFNIRGFCNGVMPLCVVVGFITLVLRPALKWFIKSLPQGEPVKQVYVLGILLGALIMSFISDIVAGSPVLGIAFLGLVIPSGPPLGTIIQDRSEMFIKNCLLPFFYLAVGDMTDIFGMNNFKVHIGYQSILVIGYCVKTLVTMMVATYYYSLTPRLGLALGLLMNTGGVLNAMVFFSYTLRQTMYSNQASHLILNSLVVTALVTPLSFYLHKRRPTIPCNSNEGLDLSFLAKLEAPRWRLQILACIDSEDEIAGILTLLNATHPTEPDPISVYLVHLTELAGQAVPVLMDHGEHQRICDYNGCVHITSTLDSFYESCDKEGVSIQLMTMITPFKCIPEGIRFLAQDKMIPLLIVPFVYKTHTEAAKYGSSDLNRKLQSQMPCTVGILVHRDKANNKLQGGNQGKFCYRVAVIFFGGEDDREALAFATRMSKHPRLSITLIRIRVKEFRHLSRDEKNLDKSMVSFFKSMVTSKARAHVFQEVHVEDWLQALDVVRKFDNNYDLVMVGRRHGETDADEGELSVLCEKPELGFIGEIFVSNEHHWGNSSVLVMQHCSHFGRDTTKSKIVGR